MALEFERVYLLALAIPALLFIWLTARRYARRTIKGRVSLALRYVMVMLCVLAIASPGVLISGGMNAAWVLTDASDSAKTARARMTDDLKAAIADKGDDLSVGVIAFGQSAMVESPLSSESSFEGLKTTVGAQGSRVSDALRLASALLPGDASGRIVVLSDGQTDDADAQAALLAERGIAVDVLLYDTADKTDAQVSALSVPGSVYTGQSFNVLTTIDSTHSAPCTLVLYQNSTPVATRETTLRKGRNTFTFTDIAAQTGVVTYEVKAYTDGDEVPQNNAMSAYLRVLGAPNILLVEGAPGQGGEMQKMLSAVGMQTSVILPSQIPSSAEALRQYDGIVLVNADAADLSDAQLSALDGAVRVLGRGLAVIGGDSSYAPGGYRGSKLESMLPVTIDVKSKLDMPALALVLVIDKSGSMTAGQAGVTRLELAKEAAMRACEVLTPQDYLGVIAFDDAAKWVVELQRAQDVPALQEMIGTIRPGGGTSFYSPISEAARVLLSASAAQKHVIFLTDGESGDTGYQNLVDAMRKSGITMTTVAVGEGADAQGMRELAALGGGRFYQAGEYDNIPKIFTKETYLVSGSYVQNRVFTPVVTQRSALTDFAGFPQLSGYMGTTEKPLATVSMTSDTDEPLLAWWRYGAGTVLCWTSDASGAWTGAFLSWDDAPSFFGGLVSKTLPQGGASGELEASVLDGILSLTYTAPQEAQAMTLKAQVLLPDQSVAEAPLVQTAAGVYTAQLSADAQGAYAVRVLQSAEGGDITLSEGGAVHAYSSEYDLNLAADKSALERLALLTGGRVLTDKAQMLSGRGQSARTRVRLTDALVVCLLILFILDVALRRLPWEDALASLLSGKKAKSAIKPEASADKDAPSANAQSDSPAEAPAGKRKKPRGQTPEQPAPADTAQTLLRAQQKRKIL